MSQNWLSLANEARKAASGLLAEERYRSCVSRTHYAAYSKVTHELVFSAQLTMPTGREGPSHARLRPLIETSMPKMNQKKREKLSELIGRLCTLRIDADYRPSVEVESRDARDAISIMMAVFDAF